MLHLSPEQIMIVEDALECSCDVLLEQFEQNKFSRDIEKRKVAVKAYGKLRRQSKMLTEVRKLTQGYKEVSKNNVLLLIANKG